MRKLHKQLNKLLRNYGLHIEFGSNHAAVVDEKGQYITSVSQSPTCDYAGEKVLRELIKSGHLPPSAFRRMR